MARKADDQLGKDTFLKLLVAQLKYQNPLSPTDPSQFMAQTAQFTMVETLQKISAESSRQRAVTESMTATNLLGRQITYLDDNGLEHTGTVTGTSFGTAGATLHVGTDRVPLDHVAGVSTATPTTTTTAPTGTTQEA
jgi:flagellar basal-body rod modification protein FlgD